MNCKNHTNGQERMLEELLSAHPTPWSIEYHEMKPHWRGPCISSVNDADGNALWTCETYTGDGDQVCLSVEATEYLVGFINAASALAGKEGA